MNPLTDLQILRDELAQIHFVKNESDDELATMSGCLGRIEPRFSGFCYGFDAAQAEFLKREAVLKDALEFYANKAFSDEEELCGFFKPWMSDKGRRAVLALKFLDEGEF